MLVKKTAHSREYPSKHYAPKRSSPSSRFDKSIQACSTSSFSRGDKLKTDDRSERDHWYRVMVAYSPHRTHDFVKEVIIQEVQSHPNLEENKCLVHDDEGKCLTPEQKNDLDSLLKRYETVFEPEGKPTPFT
ncbi:hypothetical protein NPIL_418661 [Nephila pilipes]|uniref:Uncharacterized protein n=1 Tax=Nephila pilipes TaxID=299642 RepID=A0A8X6ILE7_NEPPI|nr:hypothetical protein NPIL_418661 [Nephila pilipes]